MPFKKVTGIYRITNIQNNKVYIGSSKSIYSRWSAHRYSLRSGTHFSTHLQSAWSKYGEESFQFELIEECQEEELISREEHHIVSNLANNRSFGYNTRTVCDRNNGIKASEETRKKLRLAHLGHKRSEEAHTKIVASQHKKVCQFDSEGVYISTYNSILEASYSTGIGKALISACCRKVIPWTKKTFWCFEKEKEDFKIPEIKKRTGGWINGIREKKELRFSSTM